LRCIIAILAAIIVSFTLAPMVATAAWWVVAWVGWALGSFLCWGVAIFGYFDFILAALCVCTWVLPCKEAVESEQAWLKHRKQYLYRHEVRRRYWLVCRRRRRQEAESSIITAYMKPKLPDLLRSNRKIDCLYIHIYAYVHAYRRVSSIERNIDGCLRPLLSALSTGLRVSLE
jgi:hypothetical protein